MDFFTVSPDFVVIDKYHPLSVPSEIFKTLNTPRKQKDYLNKLTKIHAKKGLTIGIESYVEGNKEWFTQESIDKITSKFQDLVGEYEILEHFDNILYIIVSEIQAIDSYYNYLQQETYDFQQRMKELAGFIYALKATPERKVYELRLTSTDRESNKQIDNFKIIDQKLIKWLSRFAIDEVDNGRSPLGLFGIHENAVNRKPDSGPSTLRELKDAASIHNVSRERSITVQTVGRFCLTLIGYLNDETSLKIDEHKKSNDKQLQFLYEVCKMFNLLQIEFEPGDLSSTPKRYMRVLLTDTRKAIKKALDEKSSKS